MRQLVARLLRAPAFVLTACVSLALAVGANSAIFSIVNALWFRPLPVRDPGRVVVPYYPVVHSADGELLDDVRLPAAEQLRALASFETVTFELSTARVGEWRPIIRLKPSLHDVPATAVTANYFEALGIAVRGRSFAPEDDTAGAQPVAIVSDRLSRRLALDSPVGSVMETTRGPLTIVGVAPADFHGPRLGDQVDLWIPLGALGAFSELGFEPRMRPLTPVVVFARLRPDLSIEAAETEVRTVLDRRTTLRALREVAFPLRSAGALVRQQSLVRTLWLAAVLVLLLGAANLAALLMARAAAQKHQWAVRLSVGSSRQALVRSVILEVGMLAAAGLAFGLIVRFWLLKSIAALEPAAGVPVSQLDVSLDVRVTLFAAAIVLVSAGVASIGAARQAARSDLSALLASGSPTATARGVRGRQILLAAHVALAMTLLITAVALVGTVRHALGVNLGFARDQTLFARVRPAITQFMGERDDPSRRIRDYGQALVRLRGLPGITDVSYGARLIDAQPRSSAQTIVTVDGIRRQISMARLDVGPDYLRAAGAEFLEGRDLTEADADAAVTRSEMLRYVMMRRLEKFSGPPPRAGRSAAVIDATLASQLWPGASALGRTFRVDSLQITYEIVGVVDTLGRGFHQEAAVPTVLAPVALTSLDGMQAYDLIARTSGNPETARPLVAGVLRELFPDAPVLEVKTARQLLNERMSQERMGARIFSWYALSAGLLGLIGMYGLLRFLTAQMHRDLAIRAALGAGPGALIRMTAAPVLAPVTVGVLAGLLLSDWLRRILGSTVIGLNHTSVRADASAAALFMLAALVVAAIGLRRLHHVNPTQALRQM